MDCKCLSFFASPANAHLYCNWTRVAAFALQYRPFAHMQHYVAAWVCQTCMLLFCFDFNMCPQVTGRALLH
jgi:hypothetical protein